MDMKILVVFALFFTTFNPIQAQDDVNLFNYWKYYSDAENTLIKYSFSVAFTQLEERKAEIARLQSREDFIERQAVVKRKLLKLMGEFPQKTPLNARVTGIIKKDDFRVEKLLYESIPGYFVTAALFIPEKRKGKAPAIIYASGHTDNAFRSETYQQVIINLVKKGFIVLAFDPVGQGERIQYYDSITGNTKFSKGSTIEHSYPGAQCLISGYSPTIFFVWDAMRAIDYLQTRKEVDPQRIGMTGRSGGGTQTAFTAAVDERIKAAAPECFITNMEYILKSIGAQDAEQNLYHMIKQGIDHADLLEVRAPKPVLLITTTRDFFSIQGARETFDEVKNYYRSIGFEENASMVEDDDVHASTRKNREAMYAFFQKYLDNPGESIDLEVDFFKEEELWVTETGQLVTSIGSESLYSLNKKIVEKQMVQLDSSRSYVESHLENVPDEARKISGFEYPETYGKVIFSGRYVKPAYSIEKYLIPGSGSYMLPAIFYKPEPDRNKELVLLLHEKGKEYAVTSDSLIYMILSNGNPVMLVDLPGIGELGPGYLEGDSYIGKISFNQWFNAIMTGNSHVGLRAEDIMRVVHCIKTNFKEYENFSVLSYGALGSELLHSAVFDDNIRKICLIQPFLSFAEIALSAEYEPEFIPSTVAGAIEKYDLIDLIAASCPKKVMILNPLTPGGDSISEVDIKEKMMKYPRDIYSLKGVSANLIIITGTEDGGSFKNLLSWLR